MVPVARRMLMRFLHEKSPHRVVFATDAAADAVANEVSRLGRERVMVIAGRRSVAIDAIGAALPTVVHHREVLMHVPVEAVNRARDAAAQNDVDVVVCIGGGSATGLAKAVALTSGVPIVAVPTTYAGSEATDV